MTEITNPERSYRLYERNTYQRTPYLVALVDYGSHQIVTEEDIVELWRTFKEGSDDAGVEGFTMTEFVEWLTATGAFGGCQPAEVVW